MEEEEIEGKKRRPVVAALLSIAAPGLGQIYNGQMRKGIAFYGAMLALALLFIAWDGLRYQFTVFHYWSKASLALILLIAAEAFISARKIREITPRPYNRWYYYALIFVLASGLNVGAERVAKIAVGIKTYAMPSASMAPELESGDRVYVNLHYYRHRDPARGDVVVYELPQDPERLFIKRVVAVGGDVIECRDKVVYLNGKPLEEPYASHGDSAIMPADAEPRDNFGPVAVPKGKFFVMGDNRDQSFDSRNIGPIDRAAIKGRALYVYWSKKRERIGQPVE